MEFTLDYASLAKKLENQELESPNGRASPEVYGQLLAIYLLFNDLTSAKFLWKRIPPEIKSSNEELSLIWLVGKLMWKRNYSEIYSVINSNSNWPKHLKNIMNLIINSIRKRSIALINKAYSTVSINDASKLLGLTRDETIDLSRQLDWDCDEQQCYFEIKKSTRSNGDIGVLDNGTELLTKLTDYILFLESSTPKASKA